MFDVDDPFDQIHGPDAVNNPGANPASVIANVNLIDNGQIGGDNRGTTTGLGDSSAVTDANGEARITITVSMQPGDNYRAAASVISEAVQTQIDQTNADALSATQVTNTDGTQYWKANGGFTGYQVPTVWSPMLTVWRKLHVETDSMARPTFAENTINTQWNQPRFPGGGGLVLDIDNQDSDEHFENGFIKIKAAGFPDLISLIITYENTILGWDDIVHTSITEAQWGARPTEGNWPCTISDDDLADEARFTAGVVGSDIGTGNPPNSFLALPDTTGLVAHYQPAYILPVVEGEHSSEGAYPFEKNMNPEAKSEWDPGRLVLRGLPVSTGDYWTVYVFSAFQGLANNDSDSEPLSTKGVNTHPDGSTRPRFLWGGSYTGMVAVFVEVLRDGYLEIQKQRTVAHEIAHTLGAAHLGNPDVPGSGGLMDKTDQGPAFLAESLKSLREYVEP